MGRVARTLKAQEEDASCYAKRNGSGKNKERQEYFGARGAVDPPEFAPGLSLVKGDVLLHKLRARAHNTRP